MELHQAISMYPIYVIFAEFFKNFTTSIVMVIPYWCPLPWHLCIVFFTTLKKMY
jgi:hypothetical protein